MARVLVSLLVVWGVTLPSTIGAFAPQTRVVYVTVTDANGAPVAGLTSADFVVKEAGKERQIVEAAVATASMRIAIIVDDNGTGIFRAGVARFIQRLQGRAEFAMSTVAGQHLKIVDYTASADRLVEAIGQIRARPGAPDGGQLLEGVFETARDFEKRRAERPVIVVLTVGGEEHSPLQAHHVLDQLQKSGAILHVMSSGNSALRSTVNVQKPADLLEGNLNLSEVLGDGPRQSGGSRSQFAAAAGGPVLGLYQLAEELINQYAVSYVQPDGVKASDKISVSVHKPGVTVRAPARIRAR
jgi:VWFA-related protein